MRYVRITDAQTLNGSITANQFAIKLYQRVNEGNRDVGTHTFNVLIGNIHARAYHKETRGDTFVPLKSQNVVNMHRGICRLKNMILSLHMYIYLSRHIQHIGRTHTRAFLIDRVVRSRAQPVDTGKGSRIYTAVEGISRARMHVRTHAGACNQTRRIPVLPVHRTRTRAQREAHGGVKGIERARDREDNVTSIPKISLVESTRFTRALVAASATSRRTGEVAPRPRRPTARHAARRYF